MKKNQTKSIAVISLIIIALAIFTYFSQPPETIVGAITTITYNDGSTETFDTAHKTSEMRITTTGGTIISSIKVECYITPVFEGSIQSYSVSGAFQLRIQQSVPPYSIVYNSQNMNIYPLSPQPILVSGQSKVITSATLTSAQIQALYGGWVNGLTYNLQYSNPSPITIAITFTDGSVQTKSVTVPNVSYVFKYIT